MPVMDGYEVAQRIRKLHQQKNLPQPMIVACTGHVEEEYIRRAWTCQIDEVVTKPVCPDVLKDIFEELL